MNLGLGLDICDHTLVAAATEALSTATNPMELSNTTNGVTQSKNLGCHLPVTWDHLATSFASGMGPPPLPVMGPP